MGWVKLSSLKICYPESDKTQALKKLEIKSTHQPQEGLINLRCRVGGFIILVGTHNSLSLSLSLAKTVRIMVK